MNTHQANRTVPVLLCLLCFLPLLGGCGGDSSSGAFNGNSTSSSATSTSSTGIGTTGGSGTGPPFTQTGAPLANAGLPVGEWGGAENVDGPTHPAHLTVSQAGGRLTLYCGASAQYAGPITLDGDGRFVVRGTGHIRLNPLQVPESGEVLFSGRVVTTTAGGGNTTNMVLSVTDPVTGDGAASYVLFLDGGTAAYAGVCAP